MVDPDHVALSITRQCRLVSIARSSFYYEGTGESPLNLQRLRRIDEQFLETPFYGSRQMTRWLLRQGTRVSRKRVRRLMRLLGLQAIFQRPRTSEPHPAHRIYPYLLRDLAIARPNHVWCPAPQGFLGHLIAREFSQEACRDGEARSGIGGGGSPEGDRSGHRARPWGSVFGRAQARDGAASAARGGSRVGVAGIGDHGGAGLALA